ncbi:MULTISPECIES: succinyl-diaminopimelate desuccinylase [Frankia]|uniref:Succinyl-diaminopimelate desuccinylase n=2 Tax=Frankia TaxID=1854 RepID=Q0RGT7_FRAAA|nr:MULTISPECIES: succinyl-diaminopimelate desuccinylase [Frankia]CAJ63299.1 succinyl-diaminopimelate desuccinylase like [Frankia alni ACN14a]
MYSQSGRYPTAGVEVLERTDLLRLAAALVEVPSVSGDEHLLAGLVEHRLRARAPGLRMIRDGNNIIATTRGAQAGKPARDRHVVLAGHLDTVPAAKNYPTAIPGTVSGLGAVDMKGGLAVMLVLAERAQDSDHHLTFVFYDNEEVGSRRSGMTLLFDRYQDFLQADLAILLEPTGGLLEAGCQGNLVVELRYDGSRAHTARPWRGVNAIHRATPALARFGSFEPGPAVVDGLTYRQSLSVVGVSSGVQGNVVPDACQVRVNFRHAPNLSSEEALGTVVGLAGDADGTQVVLSSPPAPPNLEHPLLAALRASAGVDVRPKLGWTDVGRFAAHGVPAVNFGPGDSELAHTGRETVSGAELAACHAALARFLFADAAGIPPDRLRNIGPHPASEVRP